ncbi:MAG: type II toxin-antitoxin system RelE/ParE family toxin [Patescibacteria group bacterium]
MDKIEKELSRLSAKERARVREILEKLLRKDMRGVEVKKLKARKDIFRVRKGNIRIIYRDNNGATSILAIERRNDNTYKKF